LLKIFDSEEKANAFKATFPANKQYEIEITIHGVE